MKLSNHVDRELVGFHRIAVTVLLLTSSYLTIVFVDVPDRRIRDVVRFSDAHTTRGEHLFGRLSIRMGCM